MLKKLIRYLVSGGMAAIVDIATFRLLHVTLDVELIQAATASWFVAMITNYLISSFFVFKLPIRWARFLSFSAAAALGAVVNVSTTAILANEQILEATLAKVAACGTAFLFNFCMNYFIVFRNKRTEDSPKDVQNYVQNATSDNRPQQVLLGEQAVEADEETRDA
jgi:putative flippase GtrA